MRDESFTRESESAAAPIRSVAAVVDSHPLLNSVGLVCLCGRAWASMEAVARTCKCGRTWIVTAALIGGDHART